MWLWIFLSMFKKDHSWPKGPSEKTHWKLTSAVKHCVVYNEQKTISLELVKTDHLVL